MIESTGEMKELWGLQADSEAIESDTDSADSSSHVQSTPGVQ